MKKLLQSLLLTLALFAMAPSPANAVTVSGTIYTTSGIRGGTIVPVSGATVWIYYDFNGPAYIATTTSSTGAYSITVPSTWGSSTSPYPLHYINVRDTGGVSCSNYGQKQFVYWGTSIVYNDTLCNYPWYTISGHVSLQGAGAADSAKVWLIGADQDTATGSPVTVLRAYDSTYTDAVGNYFFTKATGYWITTQRVKAALQSSDPNYLSFLPTYHDSALNWSTATTFSGSAWTSSASNLDISLRGGTNPGGPGFIGGDVLLGANKSTGVGDPLNGRIILLTTLSGKGVAYAYSDVNGHFSFTNLPYGDYKLFGDAWGKTNPALTISLSAATPTISNVIFEENSSTFSGKMLSLGVTTGTRLQEVKVYPTPMESFLQLTNLQAISGSKTAVLRDITGAVVSREEIAAGISAFRINTARLSSGMYMLELNTADGAANYKVMKN